ncbi:hypothetical protein F5146DRAFT_995234 [Armillaria mellea]|nr:hypothetical protein F5146DRAFT_1007003 [Armillaria mellea]KAK0197591.1 hypothetical protein F5146DRAFT_995234 [Armillaria mellea]
MTTFNLVPSLYLLPSRALSDGIFFHGTEMISLAPTVCHPITRTPLDRVAHYPWSCWTPCVESLLFTGDTEDKWRKTLIGSVCTRVEEQLEEPACLPVQAVFDGRHPAVHARLLVQRRQLSEDKHCRTAILRRRFLPHNSKVQTVKVSLRRNISSFWVWASVLSLSGEWNRAGATGGGWAAMRGCIGLNSDGRTCGGVTIGCCLNVQWRGWIHERDASENTTTGLPTTQSNDSSGGYGITRLLTM